MSLTLKMVQQPHKPIKIITVESKNHQFTRQAVPFSNFYGHTNQESVDLLKKMASVSDRDTVLDVAGGVGIVACAFGEVSNRVTCDRFKTSNARTSPDFGSEKKLD